MEGNKNKIDKDVQKSNIKYLFILPLVVSFFYFVPGFINKNFVIFYYSYETEIDRMIPYLSIFLIPYLFFLPYLVVGTVFIYKKNEYTFKRYFIAVVIGSILAGLTYFFKPSENVSQSYNDKKLPEFIQLFIKNFGVRGTGFPSIVAFLASLLILSINEDLTLKKEKKIKLSIIGAFIIISGILVKQYSLVDIIGGILLAVLSWKISKNDKFISYLK